MSKPRRSGCPVSISLEILGDRWSLLVIRDLMVRGFRTFKDFLGSGEGIATNVLSDRLQKLEAAGLIVDWNDFADISSVTPLLARVYPNGTADVNQFHAAGGMAFTTVHRLTGLHPKRRLSLYFLPSA